MVRISGNGIVLVLEFESPRVEDENDDEDDYEGV
jgi:hypothetical protein